MIQSRIHSPATIRAWSLGELTRKKKLVGDAAPHHGHMNRRVLLWPPMDLKGDELWVTINLASKIT